MREWMKKRMTEAAALVLAMGVFSACQAYSPDPSGTDNSSGAAVSGTAVSGTAVAGQEDRGLSERGKQETGETKALKYNPEGGYFCYIDVNCHSANYFYVSNCLRYENYWHIDQISPDCHNMKETGITSREEIAVLGVREDWLFYETAGKIYRVPIVAKKKSESLDVKKKKCIIKNSVHRCSLLDGKKLYYMTEGKAEVSKDAVREELQIHCLDLETEEESLCPEKILVVEDRETYEDDEQQLDVYPYYNVTEDYIYYREFPQESGDSYAGYMYQLDKHTMELSLVDALELCDNWDECDAETSCEMAEDGSCIWYIKATGGNKNRYCEYEICRYDVERQQKRVIGTEAGCLDLICKERKIDSALVGNLNLEIIYSDEDKTYVEYEISYVGENLIKECRNGVIVYSLSADKWELLGELASFFGKYLSEDWGEDDSGEREFLYRESDVSIEGVLVKEQQFLLCVENYDEKTDYLNDWYALYDLRTKKIVKIPNKKGEKLEEQAWKERIEKRRAYWY